MRAPLAGTLLLTQLFGGGVKYGESYTTWINGQLVKVIGHTGLDINSPIGTPVHAVWPGTVYHGYDASGFGNYLVLHVADGRQALYAHLSAYAVASGAMVGPGAVIAYSGMSGHATGPHLHFQIKPPNPDYHNGYAGATDPITGFDHDVIPLLDLSLV